MSYSIISQRGEVEAYVAELVCNAEADLQEIDKDKFAAGTTCLLADTSEVYILDPNKEWKKL